MHRPDSGTPTGFRGARAARLRSSINLPNQDNHVCHENGTGVCISGAAAWRKFGRVCLLVQTKIVIVLTRTVCLWKTWCRLPEQHGSQVGKKLVSCDQ
uniref:Uncharacterized protein n=1 Tax=Hyaloperonospora arabidopsidis (strain Emoy2) TaxID=559515 RepID=M4BZX9_HYAAE